MSNVQCTVVALGGAHSPPVLINLVGDKFAIVLVNKDFRDPTSQQDHFWGTIGNYHICAERGAVNYHIFIYFADRVRMGGRER